MIIKHNLLFKFLFLIDAEFTVYCYLGGFLRRIDLVLLRDELLAILSFDLFTLDLLKILTFLAFNFFALDFFIFFLVVIRPLFLTEVVTSRVSLILILLLLQKFFLRQLDLILTVVFEHASTRIDDLLVGRIHTRVDVLEA